MNQPDGERFVSAIAGVGLVGASLSRRGLKKWILFLVGIALVRRGWSGECPLYRSMGVDLRHEAQTHRYDGSREMPHG